MKKRNKGEDDEGGDEDDEGGDEDEAEGYSE